MNIFTDMLGSRPLDAIEHEDKYTVAGPLASGLMTAELFAFNTRVTLQAFGPKGTCTDAFEAARSLCRVYERLFSRMLPNSDISLLNAAAGAPVEITQDTYNLLMAALYYCEESQGAFDITVGSAMRLWDFRLGVVPEADALAEATAHVNWQALRLWVDGRDDVAGAVLPEPDSPPIRYFARLDDPLAAIDVGGIAKGYIADNLSGFLAAAGIESHLINLGGNVIARGLKPGGKPWRVGLRRPDGDSYFKTIDARDCSVVTSGTYERCFERDGVLYHHILDPKTGHPVASDAVAVSVVAEHSLDAEGYSTTLLAKGVAEGLEFARSHPEILAVYFIDEAGAEHSL